MAGLSITADGNSEWLPMHQPGSYRVTIEATTWGGSTAVKLEHASESGLPIRVKTVDDSAEWEVSANEGRVVAGPGRVRAVVANYSGSEGMLLRVEPTDS